MAAESDQVYQVLEMETDEKRPQVQQRWLAELVSQRFAYPNFNKIPWQGLTGQPSLQQAQNRALGTMVLATQHRLNRSQREEESEINNAPCPHLSSIEGIRC